MKLLINIFRKTYVFIYIFYFFSSSLLAEDLSKWMIESYPEFGFGAANWQINNTNSVTQTNNGTASILYSDKLLSSGTFSFSVSSSAQDDDSFGFVLGFMPGDTSSVDANYIAVTWKQVTQPFNFTGNLLDDLTPTANCPMGLNLLRITGTPSNDEICSYNNFIENPDGGVEVLAIGSTLGSIGWEQNTVYDFNVLIENNRLQVFVNGSEEFNYPINITSGRPGLYNFSQADTVYSNVFLESNSFQIPLPLWSIVYLAICLLFIGLKVHKKII